MESSNAVHPSSFSPNVSEQSECLNVLSTKSCGLLFPDEELQNNAGLYLGCDFAVYYECSAKDVDGAKVYSIATHSLSCTMSKGMHLQHSEVIRGVHTRARMRI